ncbi:hypothetical protein FRB95_003366 [Tulasnella sp. JGI-2019a]|nr:hypothetical protein FRB95_003366 [Tulasnella sp. JGI-2019a]
MHTHLTLILLQLCTASIVSAKLSHATCAVDCNPLVDEDCQGFLSSLPLRSGLQILTTAVVTGLLAAWQSCGSGQGGLFRGIGRTVLQAFIPEIALFNVRILGYAMDPLYEEWVVPIRHECRCHEFKPTKAQIVAVHLRSLAVRTGVTPPNLNRNESQRHQRMQTAETAVTGKGEGDPPNEAGALLRYVNASSGWRDVAFHESVQPGYRLVSLSEAIFLPHLFYALPKGRKTFLGAPIYQPAMVLLVLQALYFIVVTCVRASQNLYTTTIEWFFIPTSITLILIFLANILWEPAWKDVAHVNINLGPAPLPPHSYPWTRGTSSHLWIGGVMTILVTPVGPITTLVAWITEFHRRPKVTTVVLIMGAVLWVLGFLALGAATIMGRYRPYGGKEPWVHDPTSQAYELWFSVILVLARAVVLISALYEMAYLPAEAYAQMSWAQYLPHI